MFFLTLDFNITVGTGFGFNTNILETNIINLSVVIFIVFSFVGDALKTLLQNRKEIILANLQEADKRALEAQEKLLEAQKQFENAIEKANQIKQEALLTADKEKNEILKQTEIEIKKFETSKDENLTLERQKIISQISQQVISLALLKVREKLKKSLDLTFHSSVNNFNIFLLKNYKLN
jgi:F-type H+-transporting ATPase subunit b